MDEVLAELDRRLAALRCLAPPTRRRVLEWAQTQTDPALLRAYLDTNLGFAERIAQQVAAAPAFAALADELADEESEWAVLRRFGGTGEYDVAGWSAIETRQQTDAEMAYCVANKWAVAFPNPDTDPVVGLLSQLHARRNRDGAEATARWAEGELGFGPAAYADPAAAWELVRPRLEALSGPIVLQFIAGVGDTMTAAGRRPDAAALLAAPLFSPTAGLPTAETVVGRIDGLRTYHQGLIPDEPPPDFAPDLVPRYPEIRDLLRAEQSIAWGGYVESLAQTALLTGAADLGLAAVAGFLRLPPDPRAGFAELDQLRRSFTPDLTRRLLRLWQQSLAATGRLADAADQTLALLTADLTTKHRDLTASLDEFEAGLDAGRRERVADKLDRLREGMADRGDTEAEFPAVWLRDEAPAAAVVLLALAQGFSNVDEHAAALDVLVRGLGLAAVWDDPERLGDLLRDHTVDLDNPTVFQLAGAVLGGMWMCGHALAGLAAFEAALGLDADSYASSDVARERFREYWAGAVPAIGELVIVHRLAVLLNMNGRRRHALRLLMAVNPELCRSWDVESYNRIRAWFGDLPGHAIDEFLSLLGLLLQDVRPAATFDLLAAHLGLAEVGFDDPAAVAAALHARRRRMPPTSWTAAVSGLLSAAHQLASASGEPGTGLVMVVFLGEAALGIGPGWYGSGTPLPTPSGWPGDGRDWVMAASEFTGTLAGALIDCGRAGHAADLTGSAVRELSGVSYRDPAFLRELFSPTRPMLNRHMILSQLPFLVGALAAAGRDDEAYDLARGLTADPDWFSPDRGATGLSWFMIDILLPVLARRDPAAALGLARRFVPSFRTFGLREDVTGIDRVALIQFTQDVRHHLIQTGFDAVAADPGGAVGLRLETLCWDAELGQLMLRERYERQPPRAATDHARLPAGLPFPPGPAADDDAPALALRAVPGPPLPPVVHLDGSAPPAAPDGVTTAALASALGRDERLLRVGFTTAGRVVWTLFAVDPDDLQLRVVADERTAGPADRDARAAVAAAVAAHDAAMTAAWAAHEATWRREWIDPNTFRLHPPQVADRIRAQQRRVAAEIDAELRSALDAATARFLDAVAAALPLTPLADLLTDDHDLVVQVDDVLHAVPFGFLPVGGRYLFERVRSVRVSLSVTIDTELGFLDSTQGNPDWFDRDPDRPAAPPPRVVGLSWFESAAQARQFGRPFHRGLAGVAARARLAYRAAGEEPAGGHAALAAELAAGGPVRVLAVLGHGRAADAGVDLADGLWTGAEFRPPAPADAAAGCDLAAVEFLIQVSCSVGRVRQTGARDVDGFCANLVVGRVRAALAGLWDLFAEDAVGFAVDLTRRYLAARAALDADRALGFVSFDLHRPRARAVAAARRAWRAVNRGPVPARLNTVAGFELYGRG